MRFICEVDLSEYEYVNEWECIPYVSKSNILGEFVVIVGIYELFKIITILTPSMENCHMNLEYSITG